MKNNLNFDHYVTLNIDYSKIVNSTLDIEKVRSLAKQLIINLGIDPTDVGI